jgi:5-aminolevulinate synthase
MINELRDALVAVWAALELPREVPAEASSEVKLNPGDLTLPTVGG